MLFTEEQGSGLPVIFIHGYPLNLKIWQHQFELATHFRIITLDLPGMGQSAPEHLLSIEDFAKSISAWMDNKEIDKAVFFGHSMGGYILLALHELFSERIMASGFIHSHPFADTEEVRATRISTINRVDQDGTEFIVESMSEKLLSEENFEPHSVLDDTMKSIMRETSPEAVKMCLRAMAHRKDLSGLLPGIKTPVFNAIGRYDRLISPEKSLAISKAVLNCTTVEFLHSGHMAMMEEPQIFNSEVLPFLKALKF